ncbi:hypothetical protein A3K73_02760 [Candidatus Pacearchaeota archaeon RBG_13_36_9]|nr:MAG: hypothetical protein A3K73_02760 [Candidatus Pacearchaeota archaeon RBG_13_36_9]
MKNKKLSKVRKKKNLEKYRREIDFKYNLSVYWSFLRKYKFLIVVLLLTTLISSATYIIEKFLFKVIIDNGTSFSAGTLAKEAFLGILFTVVLVYLGALLVRAFLNFFNVHLLIQVSDKMIQDLKTRFFNHIIGLSHGFHTTHKTGSLISRIMRGGGAIDALNDVIIFDTAPLVFQIIMVSASLIYYDLMAVAVIFLTVVFFVGFSVYIQDKSKPYGGLKNKKDDAEKANLSDFLTNIESIRYYGKEDLVKQRYRKLTEESKKADIVYSNFFRSLSAGQVLILGMGIFFLIYFPAVKFLDGQLTLGDVVFIYTIYSNVVGPLWGFVHGIRQYYRSMIDFQDLFQYGKIENEIKDRPGAKKMKISEGEVDFKNVSFSYDKRKIFQNFSLKVPKNKKFALVGHSGCGKTTLVKLLYRLYDINQGEILVDGVDVRDVQQESLRSEMSIVPQECVLFDDTIYNNVAFSKPNATRQEVFRAIKFAQLDKIIKTFPKKENTIVGERGVKLSGGEKQRVSIARAILANKKILVLDEATSSLDSETEHEIQKDLARLMEGRTAIIIAHRLSTIMHADKIVVMKRGRIVQMGRHDELIRQQGEYRHLWEIQKGGYIE